MRRFLCACGVMLPILACSATFKDSEPYIPGTIFARWEYRSCSYKNTGVKGYIDFRRDGTFVIDIKVRDDTGGSTIRGTYACRIEGNRIITGYDRGYGIEEFFLIEGGNLFLSGAPLEKAVVPEDPRRGANWGFMLKRVQ